MADPRMDPKGFMDVLTGRAQAELHLGDGAYARIGADGNLWVWAPREGGPHYVCLGTLEWQALAHFMAKIVAPQQHPCSGGCGAVATTVDDAGNAVCGTCAAAIAAPAASGQADPVDATAHGTGGAHTGGHAATRRT